MCARRFASDANQRQKARRSHSIPSLLTPRTMLIYPCVYPRRHTTSRQTQMHLVELALRIFHSGLGSLFLVQRLTVCRLRVNPGSVCGGLLSVGRQVLLEAHVLLRRQVRCQSGELVCAHRGSKEHDGRNADSQCRMQTLYRACIRTCHPPRPANARHQHTLSSSAQTSAGYPRQLSRPKIICTNPFAILPHNSIPL